MAMPPWSKRVPAICHPDNFVAKFFMGVFVVILGFPWIGRENCLSGSVIIHVGLKMVPGAQKTFAAKQKREKKNY